MVAPVRPTTRRVAASSPSGVTVAHLLASAATAARGGAAGLAQALAAAGLKLATAAAAPLPRGAAHALCLACATPYAPADYADATVVRLRARRPRRRWRQGDGGDTKKAAAPPSNAAGLRLTCGGCGRVRLRRFYTAEVAEAARRRGCE